MLDLMKWMKINSFFKSILKICQKVANIGLSMSLMEKR
jgi:hypothetical protein